MIVVEYSEASIGRVPPPDVPALFNDPSALTMTQLLPVAPGVVVKVKPVKLDAVCIWVVVKPVVPVVTPKPTSDNVGLTVVSQ